MSDPAVASPVDLVGGSFVAAASAALSATFRTKFAFWVRQDGRWRPIADGGGRPAVEGQPDGLRAEVERRLNDGLAGDGQPECLTLDDGWRLLVIPLRRPGAPRAAATARIRTECPDLARQLARLFLKDFEHREQLHRLRDENNAFAMQATENMEELVLLRNMAQQLEIGEHGRDMLDMARTILPMVAGAIRAESVVLLDAERRELDEGRWAAFPGRVLLWHGSAPVPRETARRLAARYAPQSRRQPVVKNRMDRSPEAVQAPGVRQFVLVPVLQRRETFGWLLALNRIAADGDASESPGYGDERFEFGTGEATLLGSAAAMLGVHAHNVRLFREKQQLLTKVVGALVYAIEAKDAYTCGHSERVALFAQTLARCAGLDRHACERIYLTGLLHDVGKIGVSDTTLKKPGRLTEAEFAEIQTHPDGAWSILQELGPLQYVLPGVLFHHERYDGRGYPDGLAGRDIPLDARILAIADAYDAMTSDRPYRQGMPVEKAADILREGAGTQWDPELVELFLENLLRIVEIQHAYRQRPRPERRKRTIEPENARTPKGSSRQGAKPGG